METWGKRLRGIRGRVTAITLSVTVVAMAVIVGLTAFAAWTSMHEIIGRALAERLDNAQAAVSEGDFVRATDAAGGELLQVIDADGNVIAATDNARGVTALTGESDVDEIEDLELEVDERAAAKRASTQREAQDRLDDAQETSNAEAAGTWAGSNQDAAGGDSDDDGDDDESDDAGDAHDGDGDDDAHDDDADEAEDDSAAHGQSSSDAGSEEDEADDDDGNETDDGDTDGDASDEDGYDENDSDDDSEHYEHDDGDSEDDAHEHESDVGSDDDSESDVDSDDDSESDADSDDDSESDADSDDDSESDDESDDDDDEGEADSRSRALGESRHGPRIPFLAELADRLAPKTAFADEPDASPAHIMASDIMGTPGPFLIMRRHAESPQGPVTLVAMTSLKPAVEVAQNTAWEIAAILLVLLVLAAAFAWFMTGRTLRPVEQMRREVEAISPADLAKRVTTPENDPELSRLATTFNGLLARVEAALVEQRRFVSDASHELKSPIAATGLMLETLRIDAAESEGQLAIVEDLTSENDRMQRIVSDLLTLARQDEGRLAVQTRLVDYCDILFEETESLRRRHGVAVDDSDVQPVVGETDPDLISHALRNLLDNAARYAKTCVYVSCRQVDDAIEIRVSDDGPGVPPEDRERIFGRFVRLDSDRSRDQGSTGLGLAVTKGIVEQLGGTVEFCEPDHGGATALVRLG